MRYVYLICFCILYTGISLPGFSQVEAQSADGRIDKSAKTEQVEKFWFVLLKTGPKSNVDSVTRKKLFEGHMQNIERLHKDGVLKVAGPFGKNDLKWRGVFILDCATKEEAQKYVRTDPAVAAGIFEAEIVEWYSEATGSFTHGLPEIK